jgi:rare lipoprotein A
MRKLNLLYLVVFLTSFIPVSIAQTVGEEYEGQASYYHHKFNFRRTSSGEMFHNDELTAAHRYLPFGTLVEVTNVENQFSVIVKINDRGPHARNRLIDLSQGAAQAINMLHLGTARVKVKIIALPNPDEILLPPVLADATNMPIVPTINSSIDGIVEVPAMASSAIAIPTIEIPQHEPLDIDKSGAVWVVRINKPIPAVPKPVVTVQAKDPAVVAAPKPDIPQHEPLEIDKSGDVWRVVIR